MTRNGEPCRVLPTWDQLRAWLLRTHPEDLTRVVRTGFLRYAVEGVPDVERRTILEMLHTEFDVDGELYVLAEGTPQRVRAEYLAAVNDFLTAVPRSPFSFPDYAQGTEGAYLADAPGACPGRLALLDRQNITLPGQTPFEPCDLVTDGGVLVCAKTKGRSSHFSHLNTQAVTSAAMLRNVPAARDAFLDRVRAAKGSTPAVESAVRDRLDAMARGVPEALTVCLLVLGKWSGTPDVLSLPLQSRISLRSAVRDLWNLGLRVEFATASPPRTPVPVQRCGGPAGRSRRQPGPSAPEAAVPRLSSDVVRHVAEQSLRSYRGQGRLRGMTHGAAGVDAPPRWCAEIGEVEHPS
jgi:hypothetical protein